MAVRRDHGDETLAEIRAIQRFRLDDFEAATMTAADIGVAESLLASDIPSGEVAKRLKIAARDHLFSDTIQTNLF